MRTIRADELRRSIRDNPHITVINVLDPSRYEAKHIPQSINIPLSTPDFVDEVYTAVGDRRRPVVVYCTDIGCDASEQAARKLSQAGFTDVRIFAAGLRGWEQLFYPLGDCRMAGAR